MLKIIQIGAKVGPGAGIGKGNPGDTAIGSAFDYVFEKYFPKSTVHFMNCRQIFTLNDIKKINQYDVLILSGGGLLLHDTFKNSISDWQWGISKKLIEQIKIPIIVYSIGYNKFRNQRQFNKKFNETISSLANKSMFFSLRNTGSCESIKKHVDQHYHEKINLNFCPTLILNKKYKIKKRKTSSVGFVLASDRLKNRHKNVNEFANNVRNFVNYLKLKKIQTVLISHQNDMWISEFVNFDKIIDLYGKNSRSIYNTYSKIDTVVSDRGHAQMIPFAVGCKILTPISHDKLLWFLKDMGLEEFGIEESDPKLFEKLVEKYEKLQNINWKKIHQQKMKFIYQTNDKNTKLIKSLINKS